MQRKTRQRWRIFAYSRPSLKSSYVSNRTSCSVDTTLLCGRGWAWMRRFCLLMKRKGFRFSAASSRPISSGLAPERRYYSKIRREVPRLDGACQSIETRSSMDGGELVRFKHAFSRIYSHLTMRPGRFDWQARLLHLVKNKLGFISSIVLYLVLFSVSSAWHGVCLSV